MMKTLLVRFALWLLKRLHYNWGVDETVLTWAKEICKEMDKRYGPGFGDAKRRDAYALLMKKFPDKQKRELAKAIEHAFD